MLHLLLSNSRQQETRSQSSGPIELGRGPERTVPRLIVEDSYTSRDQLRLEELPGSRVRLSNQGGPIVLASGRTVATGETLELLLPIRMTFGFSTLDVTPEEPDSDLQMLSHRTLVRSDQNPRQTIQDLGESPAPETLMAWFERLLAVQRAAAGTGEFYAATARAVVDLVGLDRGAVILRRGDQWEIIAEHSPRAELQGSVSSHVLARVLVEKCTYYESLSQETASQSLAGVEAVVASPILDEQDAVIGVVYGTRNLQTILQRPGIKPLEAMVVQLLAAAVSAGLARLHQEAEASRNRVQFEQFLSRELARALEQQPGLLLGQQRDVTVLFTDLRGFTAISERIGTEETFALLGDVLNRLTDCIMGMGGVIIDYFGDGLAAMWNAPTDQSDHVQRACRAGLAMLTELPTLTAQWEGAIGRPVRIGIGIHTGRAHVGNSGSKRRLKYGPRGHTVNLASRLEGANKALGTSLLVSGDVAARLDDTFPRRHLGRALLPGVREPVELFELVENPPSATWLQKKETYELAWRLYSEGKSRECLELGGTLRDEEGGSDQPTMMLLDRAQKEIESPTVPFDPSFRLDTKLP